MDTEFKVLGKGIYTIPQAARLLRRPPPRVRRWANGYTFLKANGKGESEPILRTDRTEPRLLTFQELIELFFVREYDSVGVSIQHIRQTSIELAKEIGPHPFASQKLFTDGKILAFAKEHGFVSPAQGQLIAEFAKDFFKEVKFEHDFVSLWMPKEGDHKVVVDPERRLGQPILEESGIPTLLIYETFKREALYEPVADWFDIDLSQVKIAIEFERKFADAA